VTDRIHVSVQHVIALIRQAVGVAVLQLEGLEATEVIVFDSGEKLEALKGTLIDLQELLNDYEATFPALPQSERSKNGQMVPGFLRPRPDSPGG